ncbi:hypothetical protein GCM10009555_072690 [Acrocarpospora macrocephala]|uniref:Uncharacterized protein n=1 Tax=Acrocarpospora macrocephala TaxID=150177 RepID=A0A5M3WHY1_9ACTN|nr:hypothetical protein Amac_021800 [Acrocarpospora macrocephala]
MTILFAEVWVERALQTFRRLPLGRQGDFLAVGVRSVRWKVRPPEETVASAYSADVHLGDQGELGPAAELGDAAVTHA